MLTVTQAAAHLRVHVSRVRQFIRSGRLKATRHGARVWMIDIEDLREFEAVERVVGKHINKRAKV